MFPFGDHEAGDLIQTPDRTYPVLHYVGIVAAAPGPLTPYPEQMIAGSAHNPPTSDRFRTRPVIMDPARSRPKTTDTEVTGFEAPT